MKLRWPGCRLPVMLSIIDRIRQITVQLRCDAGRHGNSLTFNRHYETRDVIDGETQ